MEKVFFLEGVDGELLKRGVVNQGKMLTFGVGGKYLSKGPISYNAMSKKEVDIISILNMGNNLEIAVVVENKFRKYHINVNFNVVLDWINRQKGLEMTGVITEHIGGKSYNQYLYAYRKGNLNLSEMEGVMQLELK